MDMDDYSDIRNALQWFWRIRARFPKFKCTLWTVPGWSTPQFLHESAKWDWVQLGLHGWTHEADEVQKWTEFQIRSYMGVAEEMKCFVKGFHSPGWGHSNLLCEVLKLGDWFYQAHPKNERKEYFPEFAPPEGLRVYYPGEESQTIGKWELYGLGWAQEPLIDGKVLRIHGHTGDVGVTNSISSLYPKIMSFPEDTEFLFISELWNT
jgi:hypothetical protein